MRTNTAERVFRAIAIGTFTGFEVPCRGDRLPLTGRYHRNQDTVMWQEVKEQHKNKNIWIVRTVRSILGRQRSLQTRRPFLLSLNVCLQRQGVTGKVHHILVRVHCHEVAWGPRGRQRGGRVRARAWRSHLERSAPVLCADPTVRFTGLSHVESVPF